MTSSISLIYTYYIPGTCLSSILGIQPSKKKAFCNENRVHLGSWYVHISVANTVTRYIPGPIKAAISLKPTCVELEIFGQLASTTSRRRAKSGQLNGDHPTETKTCGSNCWWFRNPKQPPEMVIKPRKWWKIYHINNRITKVQIPVLSTISGQFLVV